MKIADAQYLFRAGKKSVAKQVAVAVLGGGLNPDYWEDEIAIMCDFVVRRGDRIEGYTRRQ